MAQNGIQLPSADAQAARFWQQKYLELLVHTNQVIAELNRPLLQEMGAQMALLRAAQGPSPAPTPESAPAGQPGTRNGHSVTSDAKGKP